MRPSDCETCDDNLATTFCDDEFVFAGVLLESNDPFYPFLRVRVTAVYKDTGGSLEGADRALDEIDSIREFEYDVNERCSCPDLKQLRVDGGMNNVEVILSGNYRYGMPRIAQGDLGVLATDQNKSRMLSNKKTSTLCTILNRLRNSSRT